MNHSAAGGTDAPAARFWQQRAVLGLLLGVVLSLIEFANYYPLVFTPERLGLSAFLAELITWCPETLLMCLTVALFERQQWPRLPGPGRLALGVLAGTVIGVLVWQEVRHSVLQEHFGFRSFVEHAGQPVDRTGIVTYHGWLLLAYGGLAWGLFISRQRHVGMLAALRASEMDYALMQQQLAASQLAALRVRVDPEWLYRSLSDLARLYAADATVGERGAADRLMDNIIAILQTDVGPVRAPPAQQLAGGTNLMI